MAISKAPQTVVPYFMVLNAQQFIDFTKNVFSAEVGTVKKLEGTEGVIHAEMKIGESMIYFADTSYDGSWRPGKDWDLKKDELFAIQMFVYVNNVADTYEKAMAAGATSVMEATAEEGGQMAGFIDPFNNMWWVSSLQH